MTHPKLTVYQKTAHQINLWIKVQNLKPIIIITISVMETVTATTIIQIAIKAIVIIVMSKTM